MFRYFFDALPGDDPELRQRNIFRAINDRPYDINGSQADEGNSIQTS